MSGKDPLPREQAYQGVRATNPPNLIKSVRAPSTNDFRYPIGTLWINTTTSVSYQLVTAPGIWTILGSSAGGDIQTLTGDSGGAILPAVGDIVLAGTANEITTAGAGSTITFSLPAAITAPGSLTTTTSITATLGDITATNGDLVLAAAGNKLQIHASTAASDSVGTSAVLDGASPSQLVVATTAVTASSKIFLSYGTAGGTQGSLSVGTIVAGTSFQILSSANGDTSTVNYLIIN